MQAPYIEEYTSHLVGAPKRRHWPLILLAGVGMEAVVAGGAFIVMIISMV